MKFDNRIVSYGDSLDTQNQREDILKNLRLIIRIRWIFSPAIFLILIISSAFGLSEQGAFSENQLIVNGFNLLIILTLNLIYAILVKRIINLKPLVLFQLMIDIIHFTITIYKTGGVASPFSFLYFMVIFFGSILVSGKVSYLVASISAIFYSLIIALELFEIIPHQDFFIPFTGLQKNLSFLVLSWSFSLFFYFAFAALAAYLTGLIRKRQKMLTDVNAALDKKVNTFTFLFRTSRALNTRNTVKAIVEVILSELLEYLNLDRALLYLNVNNDHLHLYMAKTRAGKIGLEVDIPLREDAGLTARAALRRQAFNISNLTDSPYINIELAQKIGMNPFALAPLVIQEKVIGVIGIDRSTESGVISDEEFQLLQMFANQTAIAIASLRGVDRSFHRSYDI